MRAADRWRLVLFLALGVVVSALAVRIAQHYQGAGRLTAELGRTRMIHLEPATRGRLARLEARVSATYYVTAAAHMPSQMRHVEGRVTDLLEALQRAAPGRFAFQIVDPASDPELTGFASKRRVAPFRVRSVTRDSASEETVWSALALSYGAHPEVVIDGIGPAELPRLQRTIVAELDQLDTPRRPVFALSAPPGFGELADALRADGELIETSLDGDDPFPFEADVLFWMAPRRVTPARLAQLERFLDQGRSVVLAGSELAVPAGGLVAVDGGPALALHPSGYPAEVLCSHLGLRPERGLLCDARGEEVDFEGETYTAPFAIRCIAPNQNFRLWRAQPNGTLLFAAPTPLALDAPALLERGWSATVLATSSDASWVLPAPLAPAPPLSLAAMRPENGEAVAKQALMVDLAPADPWRGRVVVCAATSPFEDGLFSRDYHAHRNLLRTLVRELAADERLVIADAPLERPAPLPPLGAAERLAWRAFGVFLVPVGLVLVALARGGLSRAPRTPRRALGGARQRAWPLVVTAALALVAIAALDGRGARLDVSADRLNVLADETRAIAARTGRAGEVEVELLFSRRDRLPPAMRPWLGRLARTLGDLERAGARLAVRWRHPEDLDEAGRAALAAEGVEPVRVVTRDEEVSTVRTVWGCARLSLGERHELVSFPDARAFEDLEFRLAFALWRLETGRRPLVAFASDVPRLSAAEAHEDFQQQSLFAPSGVDVYSQARERLARAGFRVVHVNPRQPVLPEDPDLLVWMQPRRSIEPMLEKLARHLHGGGKALLAAQHFNIQSRQYRGAGFELVYWPQPQSPDVEHLWFPELGIELVREVLFDELSTRIETETQLTGRRAGRDYERQTSALPFLIRTSAAGYADSPITRHLGDQAFVWPSWLRWDDARLAELGLRATPLIETSPRTWSYAWKGGWIPPALLEGPAPEVEGASPGYLGRLPLAVLFEGRFPRPAGPLRLRPSDEPEQTDTGPWPAQGEGQLLFLGCSQLFKDERLFDPAFRADQLLVNAAASLALEPELAAIANRRRVPRGFGLVTPATRIFWRAAVPGAAPLVLVAFGLVFALVRRRAPRPPAGRQRA